MSYPILEFDPAAQALMEPSKLLKSVDIAECCVLCFFQDVISQLVEEGAKQVACLRSEVGDHPIYELMVEGKRLAVAHPGVGAPLAAGLLEETIALGCRRFIACGGAGVLEGDIAVGHLLIPTSAVRDEGTSYHYMPPSREVEADPLAVAAIEQTLKSEGVHYALAKTWTTDAFYRETPDKIRRRREEGCVTVEMEAAAFFAVARFRNVRLGQILYGGDDCSGATWDSRHWQSRKEIRRRVFDLAAMACVRM